MAKTPEVLKTWTDVSGNGVTFVKNAGPYQGTVRRIPHVKRWSFSLVREPSRNPILRGEAKTAGEAVRHLNNMMRDLGRGGISGVTDYVDFASGKYWAGVAVGAFTVLVFKGLRS